MGWEGVIRVTTEEREASDGSQEFCSRIVRIRH